MKITPYHKIWHKIVAQVGTGLIPQTLSLLRVGPPSQWQTKKGKIPREKCIEVKFILPILDAR